MTSTTKNNQSKLIKLFEAYIEGEKQIEEYRLILAKQLSFDTFASFRKIDRHNVGYITAHDLLAFLKSNKLSIIDRDAKNIIKIYDSNKDGMLSFNDILLPKTNLMLKRECASRRMSPCSSLNGNITKEIEILISRIFDKEINLIRKIELLKEDICRSDKFSPLEAYMLIDNNDQDLNGITKEKLTEFFIENERSVKQDDIIRLIHRLDKDYDSKISYDEFNDGIIPLGQIDKIKEKFPKAKIPTSDNKIKIPLVLQTTNTDCNFKDDSLNTTISNIVNNQQTVRKNNSKSPFKRLDNSNLERPTNNPLNDSVNTSISNSGQGSQLRMSQVYRSPSPNVSPSQRKIPAKKAISPMRGNEEEHLASTLKHQLEMDKNLENIRNELANMVDFNLMDIFRFFDTNGKGLITSAELNEGFRKFDIYPNSEELYLVMRKYDCDCDGLLKFVEFCSMIIPRDPDYAKTMGMRPPSYIDDGKLSEVFCKQTKKVITTLFDKIIKNEADSENLRQKLARRPLFNLVEAFYALDTYEKGFATMNDIRNLLANHGFQATDKDLFTLIKRFDRDDSGKVSFTHFIREIAPKSPIKSQKKNEYNKHSYFKQYTSCK